jgi:hypothetical protein
VLKPLPVEGVGVEEPEMTGEAIKLVDVLMVELEATIGTGAWIGVDASEVEEVGGVERVEGVGA